MKILILHSAYQSGTVSGENRVVQDEISLLRDAGHEVQLFAQERAPATRLSPIRVGFGAIWSHAAARDTARAITQFSPDVVHIHNLFPTLSPAVVRVAARHAKVVMTLHNYRLMCLPGTFLRDGALCEDCLGKPNPWRGVVHACYRNSIPASGSLWGALALHHGLRTFGRVDRFLAVSRFLAHKHIQAGMEPSKIFVKPNFAWPVSRRPDAGSYYLFLGRLAPEKGVDTLLRAWASRSDRLLIAGDGPISQALRRHAPPNVDFLGVLSSDQANVALRRARALLVPSRWYEGAPRTIIEAFAAGVPVIASDIGAMPELVRHGVSGLVVPANDVSAWDRALGQLDDDRESTRLGIGAFLDWQQRYSPLQARAHLEAAYTF